MASNETILPTLPKMPHPWGLPPPRRACNELQGNCDALAAELEAEKSRHAAANAALDASVAERQAAERTMADSIAAMQVKTCAFRLLPVSSYRERVFYLSLACFASFLMPIMHACKQQLRRCCFIGAPNRNLVTSMRSNKLGRLFHR